MLFFKVKRTGVIVTDVSTTKITVGPEEKLIFQGFPGGTEPTPTSQNSKGRRTYSVDKLLSLRAKNQPQMTLL